MDRACSGPVPNAICKHLFRRRGGNARVGTARMGTARVLRDRRLPERGTCRALAERPEPWGHHQSRLEKRRFMEQLTLWSEEVPAPRFRLQESEKVLRELLDSCSSTYVVFKSLCLGGSCGKTSRERSRVKGGGGFRTAPARNGCPRVRFGVASSGRAVLRCGPKTRTSLSCRTPWRRTRLRSTL